MAATPATPEGSRRAVGSPAAALRGRARSGAVPEQNRDRAGPGPPLPTSPCRLRLRSRRPAALPRTPMALAGLTNIESQPDHSPRHAMALYIESPQAP